MIKTILRLVFCTILLGSGVYHLIHPSLYLELMPTYLPFPTALIILTGVLEILAGLLLLAKNKNRKQGSNLAIFLLVCFFMVHIQHVLQGGSQTPNFEFGPLVAWIRLFIQPVLIGLVWQLRT